MNNSLILCEKVIVDKETSQWSIINNIESINLTIPPEEKRENDNIAIKGDFNLVTFWNDLEGRKKLKIHYRLVDREGNVFMQSPDFEMEFDEGRNFLKHKAKLEKIKVKSVSERYYFEVLRKEGDDYIREERYGINVRVEEKIRNKKD